MDLTSIRALHNVEGQLVLARETSKIRNNSATKSEMKAWGEACNKSKGFFPLGILTGKMKSPWRKSIAESENDWCDLEQKKKEEKNLLKLEIRWERLVDSFYFPSGDFCFEESQKSEFWAVREYEMSFWTSWSPVIVELPGRRKGGCEILMASVQFLLLIRNQDVWKH